MNELKKAIEKNHRAKLVFEKIDKIGKPLTRLIQRRKRGMPLSRTKKRTVERSIMPSKGH